MAVGPLVGGLLFAAGGAGAALLFNAATFLASALLTRTLAPLPPADREEGRERESVLASTRTGLRHAFANPVTRVATLALLFMFAFVAIDNVALVFLVRDTLGGGSATYGFVSAIFGAGMLLGSIGVMRRTRTPATLLYGFALGLSSVGTLATGLAPAIGAGGARAARLRQRQRDRDRRQRDDLPAARPPPPAGARLRPHHDGGGGRLRDRDGPRRLPRRRHLPPRRPPRRRRRRPPGHRHRRPGRCCSASASDDCTHGQGHAARSGGGRAAPC